MKTTRRISRAIAAPARLELLDLLSQGERSVDALAAATGLSVANASQHLQGLAGARLVESRRAAQRIYYRIADRSVETLLHALRATAEARVVAALTAASGTVAALRMREISPGPR